MKEGKGASEDSQSPCFVLPFPAMPRFRVKDTTINFHDSFDINNNNNNNNGNADEMNTYMYLSV